MNPTTLRRLATRVLIVALAGVALVVGLAAFTLFTRPGTRLAVRALDRVAGPLQIDDVDGTLAGPLRLVGLTIETGRFDIQLDRVYLDAQLGPLLRSRVRIDSLHVAGGRVSEARSAPADTSRVPASAGGGPFELPFDLRISAARVESLSLVLKNGTRIHDLAASLQGQPNRFELDGSARILTPDIAPGRLTLSLVGSLDSLRVRRADIEIAGNRLIGRGAVELRPQLSWDLELRADSIDSSALLRQGAEWPGTVSARATTRGVREHDRWRGRIRLDTIFGSLRGRRLTGHASLELELGQQAAYAIDTVYLDWGDARLSGRGRVGDRMDVSFRADLPDLSLALPGASGSVRAWGAAVGAASAPRIDAGFEGSGLSYRETRIDSLFGRLDARPDLKGDLSLDLTAFDATVGERTLRRAAIEVHGSRRDHRVQARLVHSEGDLRLEATGALKASTWLGRVHTLQLTAARAGEWQLDRKPIALVASPDSARLADELCLVSNQARLCAAGRWHRGASWQVTGSVHQLPLALSERLTPASWSLSGRLSGDLTAQRPVAGPLRFEARLRSDSGAVSYRAERRGIQQLEFQNAMLRADFGPGGARARVDLKLGARPAAPPGTVSATLELPGYHGFGRPHDDQRLAGRLDLHLENPGLLEPALPRLEGLGGSIDLSLRAGGTVGRPRLHGELDWEAGRARLPELGVQLEEIHLSAIGDESGLLTVEGTLRSGDGQLTVQGESPLAPSADAPASLRFTGDRFRAVNSPEVQLDASPDLTVEWNGERLTIDGGLEIPRARIALSEPQRGVPVSDDVVFVDSVTASAVGPELAATVRLGLGDDVRFSGFGLSGKLEGSVRIVEAPESPTTGTGELLIVDGAYQIYGQELTVDTGRVIFAGGPIANPGLDVRAYRVARDSVVAGVIVRGTLNAPLVTLFSDPSMSRQKVLAYLVTGGSVGTATAPDGGGIAGFFTKLGVKASNLLTETIAEELDLAEARIKTEGSLGTASVIAGKYLSPRLYVSAGIGIFDPDRSLQLRYLLTNQVTLLAETGDETSADVLLQIELGE